MPMSDRPHYIIDGYNYIMRFSPIDFSQEHALWDAREKLVHQMVAYLGQKKIRITIVFDGQDVKGISRKPRPAGISVRFSRAPEKADPLIIKMVSESKSPANITVVTSDKQLANICKAYGCLDMSVEAFASKMTTERQDTAVSEKYDVNMTPKDVEEWMRLFAERDDCED
jgi:predicted RNA-binding protein with PIN domain